MQELDRSYCNSALETCRVTLQDCLLESSHKSIVYGASPRYDAYQHRNPCFHQNTNGNCGEKRKMFRAIIHWVLSAIALMVATNVVPGFYVNDIQSALVAALVIGVLNATLGFILKVLTFPFAIVTFGVFLLVINAAMILLASKFVSGFVVYGWGPAFWAALILAVLGMLIRALMQDQ